MSVTLKCRFTDTVGECGVDIKRKEKPKLMKLHWKAKVSVNFNFIVFEECEYIFNELQLEASKILGGRPVVLQYKDDEGELITMGTVPEFQECLKCVVRMKMEMRILAVSQIGLLQKKVKFSTDSIRKSKAAAKETPISPGTEEAPLPQWILKLSEQLKKQLKTELLDELRAEMQMSTGRSDNTVQAPVEVEKVCGICNRSINDSTFYVCLDPLCGQLRFCRSCEKHTRHNPNHTLLKKPGPKSVAKFGHKQRSKVDQLIQKLEKKLEKRPSLGGPKSTEKPREPAQVALHDELICDNFAQEVVDLSNKTTEAVPEKDLIPIPEISVTPLHHKETSPMNMTTVTPNNTPCGTTPMQSHPQSPRSNSPDMAHFTEAVENLNAESQQDKLISFTTDEEEDSDDDQFSCISCRSDSSLLSEEFELIPLLESCASMKSWHGDQVEESPMEPVVDASDSSGRSSGFCVVDANILSPEKSDEEVPMPMPIMESSDSSSVPPQSEIQLNRVIVKEPKEAEAVVSVAVPDVTEVFMTSGDTSLSQETFAKQVDFAPQFVNLWTPSAPWTPTGQQLVSNEIPWNNPNSWTKPRRFSEEYQVGVNENEKRLMEMGFFNRELNAELLQKHQGKENQLDLVVNELISLN